MADKKVRELYDTYLDSGDLFQVLPEASGVWEEDKKLFTAIYNEIEDLSFLNGDLDDIYLEEDEGWYYDDDVYI